METLREVLKARTRALHDRLDAAVGHAAVGSHTAYTAFLSAQYAARAPIERWAEAQLPQDLRPPATAPLLAADLAQLGAAIPAEVTLDFPAHADPLGLVWAMAGSSLGNRAMLAQRRRAGLTGADRFLSDPATAIFFRALLPRLNRPVTADEADGAVAAAAAVFETFLAATARGGLRAAA